LFFRTARIYCFGAKASACLLWKRVNRFAPRMLLLNGVGRIGPSFRTAAIGGGFRGPGVGVARVAPGFRGAAFGRGFRVAGFRGPGWGWRRGWGWGVPLAVGFGLGAYPYYSSYYSDPCIAWDGYEWVNICDSYY